MKRVLSLVLALSMVLSMFTFAFAGTTLKDVAGTEYEAAVSALVELGIVNGYNDGTYQPKKVVSRAEMAKLLVISAGLEPAALVAKGVTNFSDVDRDHWATGYINVASQYGYINGYPDGTFRPDATVTYAEAVTMAVRVLGYKTVVESKGTWPTNYIAKAQELKVLKDVTYGTYADGAVRGNVALIIWNMLRTNMWDVTEENEKDGLTYGKTGETMINKYFEDYQYVDEDAEATVTGIDVKDGKVTVDIVKIGKGEFDDPEKVYFDGVELADDVDFLKLFGRRVSVLYNKDTEKIVLLTPSTSDSVVEGYMYDLDKNTTVDVKKKGDYNFKNAEEFTWGKQNDENDHSYAVAVLGTKKNVDYVTYFTIEKEGVVDEVKTKNDETTVKLLQGEGTIKIDDDAIVLIDGVAMNAEDIKAGDVLTELVAGELYIVSRETVKGSFKDIETEELAKGDDRYFLTIDKDEYEHVTVNYVVEVDEDGEDLPTTTDLADIQSAKKDEDAYKFFDEEAKLFLNFLGEVVRVEFNEVESKESVGHFYALTSKKATWDVTDKNGSTTYVELNGESYEVKNGVDVRGLKAGEPVFVKFDSKDRVKEIKLISGDLAQLGVDGYEFELAQEANGILSDKNYIGDHKVNSNTTVIKITPVYDEDDDTIIDHYKVEATKGTSALKGIQEGIVAWEDDDTFEKAAYVFVKKDATSDEKYGLVEKYNYTKGTEYLTIDGTRYEVNEKQSAKKYLGQLVSFVIDEEDNTITIKKHYATSELDRAGLVTKVEDRVATLSGDLRIDLDIFEDEMDDDCKIIVAEVSENKDGEWEFDSWEEVSIKDLKLKKDDRLATSPAGITAVSDYKNVEVLVITRGYDA